MRAHTTSEARRSVPPRSAWLATAWTILASLFAPAARAEDVVRVSGTGSALGTFQLLGAAFARANPGHRLRVLPSVGSVGAIMAVANGALEVGVSGRPLEAREEALGLAGIAYARTPLLFGVGPRTGVREITTDELVRIYRGELTTWPNGERIRLVMRPPSDVDNALLRQISPEMSAALDVAFRRPGLLVAVTNQQCDEILSRIPGAIGPTSLSELTAEERRVVPLAWNGVAPTVQNLASGAYPLVKTFFLVFRTPPSPPVARLLALLRSPEGHGILEQSGNLPLPVPPADGDGQRR
jgi:phosphate transport system substrate-binding protein